MKIKTNVLYVRLLLALIIFIVNTSCDTFTSYESQTKTTYTNWLAAQKNGTPTKIYWRLETVTLFETRVEKDSNFGIPLSDAKTTKSIESRVVNFKNMSGKKAHMVGLLTYNVNDQFIDLNQPGSFNISLYPSQEINARIGGATPDFGQTVYLKVVDYAEE